MAAQCCISAQIGRVAVLFTCPPARIQSSWRSQWQRSKEEAVYHFNLRRRYHDRKGLLAGAGYAYTPYTLLTLLVPVEIPVMR